MIKVVIADDSNVIKKIIKELIETDKDIKVIDFASNGLEVYEKFCKLKPDIIITDLKMPVYDGVYAIKEIREKSSVPIIVISAVENVLELKTELRNYGANAVFKKPKGFNYIDIKNNLINEIKKYSSLFKNDDAKKIKENLPKKFKAEILCIGSSTGGPNALVTLFKNIKIPLDIPVILIQHISSGFNSSMVKWIQAVTEMKVKIAEDYEKPQKNIIYIPDENHNLILNNKGNFINAPGDLHPFICPCIDITFKSIVNIYKGNTMGVILTGMGKDGAEGIEHIYKAGGYTIAQNEKSSIVFGMPKAAILKNAVTKVLDINDIGNHITDVIRNGK